MEVPRGGTAWGETSLKNEESTALFFSLRLSHEGQDSESTHGLGRTINSRWNNTGKAATSVNLLNSDKLRVLRVSGPVVVTGDSFLYIQLDVDRRLRRHIFECRLLRVASTRSRFAR